MHSQPTEYTTPAEALDDLCAGFIDGGPNALQGRVVPADAVPPPFHDLLVHTDEMTLKLGAFFAAPIALRVLDQRVDGDLYRRQIVLTAGPSRIVELGLVRLRLSRVPPNAAEEIVQGIKPLGRILIDHNVARRIEPRWHLQFPGDAGPLIAAGLASRGTRPAPLYGRVARIHCNHEPAIDLLEIVGGVESLSQRLA